MGFSIVIRVIFGIENQQFHLGFPTICHTHKETHMETAEVMAAWLDLGWPRGYGYGTSQFFGLKLTRFGTENDQITW